MPEPNRPKAWSHESVGHCVQCGEPAMLTIAIGVDQHLVCIPCAQYLEQELGREALVAPMRRLLLG
jgi:formylmethanofuran dehydrogenase subunit E